MARGRRNYSLVINSKFKPFTYDEMIKPLVQQTEAHHELEDYLSDLDTKASLWEGMLNKEADPELYQIYQNFSDSLKGQAGLLATQGLTPLSRQAILGLRSKYQKEITPIEQAFNTRKTQSNLQLEAKLKDPSVAFSRDAASTKLLDYVANPDLSFDVASGNDVMQKVFTQATALSKELLDGGSESLRQVLGGDYYEYVKRRGFTREAVLAAIMNSPEASPILKGMVEKAVDATGVREWNNPEAVEKITNYAKQGLWGAVGTEEAQLVNNWRAQENLRHSHSMSELRERMKEQKNAIRYPYKTNDGTTVYFNTAVNMWEDKDGNIINTPEGAPTKIGTSAKASNTSDLKFNSHKSIADNGYSIARIVMKGDGGDGSWQGYSEGDDYDGGNPHSFYSYDPGFLDRPDITMNPTIDKNTGVPSMHALSGKEIDNLPEEEWQAIKKEVEALSEGDPITEVSNGNIQIVQVSKTKGYSGKDKDYLILIKN